MVMDVNALKERVAFMEKKRESLLKLLERSDLGTLRIDVNQALEEIDDLLEEFSQTFPDSSSSQKISIDG